MILETSLTIVTHKFAFCNSFLLFFFKISVFFYFSQIFGYDFLKYINLLQFFACLLLKKLKIYCII